MKINREYLFDFAKEILSIPSPSGYCGNVIKRIRQEAEKFGLSCYETKKGNLIIDVISKKTNANTVGISAHVDTLGAMVRSISASGELMFTKVGGPLLPTLDGEYCEIHTRCGKKYTGTFLSKSPAAHYYKDAATRVRDEENMYVRIDEVVKTKEDTIELGISPGDFITIEPKFTVTDSGFIKSRFLDDKISVAAIFGLIDLVMAEKIEFDCNLKFIISTYEEVGHGASHLPDVDELIAVDMGVLGDDLDCTEYSVSICAKDSSGPYDYDMVSRLINVAKDNDVKHTIDIYPYYGSDVSAARAAGNDFKGALIGPGVHASHGMERTHIEGVENTILLLLNYLKMKKV